MKGKRQGSLLSNLHFITLFLDDSINFFSLIVLIFVFTIYPTYAQPLYVKKTILGQPFYLLTEKELAYSDHSFRQVWEACLIYLHNPEYKLKATAYAEIFRSSNLAEFKFKVLMLIPVSNIKQISCRSSRSNLLLRGKTRLRNFPCLSLA